MELTNLFSILGVIIYFCLAVKDFRKSDWGIIQHIEDVSDIFDIWHCYTRYFLSVPIAYNCHKKAVAKRHCFFISI